MSDVKHKILSDITLPNRIGLKIIYPDSKRTHQIQKVPETINVWDLAKKTYKTKPSPKKPTLMFVIGSDNPDLYIRIYDHGKTAELILTEANLRACLAAIESAKCDPSSSS